MFFHIKQTMMNGKAVTVIVYILCSLFIIAGSLISLHRFWQYEVFYYDFGIFDTVIWNVSRLQPPIIDHLAVGEKLIFADHLYPSVFIFSPLFWLTSRSEILLIAQALMVGLSGLFLYLIGKKIIKNRFYSLSILVCYFLFVGLQNAVITDFHEVTVSVLFFMLSYYFLVKNKKIPYLIAFLIFLGFKESNFLVGLGMGISILFINPRLKKVAIFSILTSLAWGIFSTKYIIPYFSGGRYVYDVALAYNPLLIFISFFDNPVKLHTLFYSFLSFGFLPLFTPAFWFLIFQDLLVRFYPYNMFLRWTLGLHYSILLAAIMGISSVFTFKLLANKIQSKVILRIFAILLIINAIFLYRFTLRGPFGLAYNPAFYANTKNFSFLERAVKQIPPNASVMAQNNLATRFSHQKVWMLRSDDIKYKDEYYTLKKPDYIMFDKRPGQNPNNYFTIKSLDVLLINLNKDRNYKLFYKDGDVYIFKRLNLTR
jgi:uncharacterized membrane protein